MKAKKIIKKLADIRLDELTEDKSADKMLCEFMKGLANEKKAELEEILCLDCQSRALREKQIYEAGFKDGMGLALWGGL